MDFAISSAIESSSESSVNSDDASATTICPPMGKTSLPRLPNSLAVSMGLASQKSGSVSE
jgi:hypothetical protein